MSVIAAGGACLGYLRPLSKIDRLIDPSLCLSASSAVSLCIILFVCLPSSLSLSISIAATLYLYVSFDKSSPFQTVASPEERLLQSDCDRRRLTKFRCSLAEEEELFSDSLKAFSLLGRP